MSINIIILLLIILCCIPIKNKRVDFSITISVVVILAFLFAFNNSSADQYAYKYLYSHNDYFSVEPGYIYLTNVFLLLNLDYSIFKLIIFLLFFALIFLRFKEYKLINVRVALLIWFLSSYCFDIEQSRFTISASIIILGSWFLEKKGIIGVFGYIVAVIIATSVHSSSLFFMVLLLYKLKSESIKKPIAIIAIGLSLIFKLNFSRLFLENLLFALLNNGRIYMWFSNSTKFGWIGPLIIQFSFYFLIKKGLKSMEKRTCVDIGHLRFVRFSYKICLIMFLAVPLYMISFEFLRLNRMLFCIYFCSLLIICRYVEFKKIGICHIFLLLFPLLFNLQGLNGLLFMNDYFVDYFILKNDIDKNVGLLIFLSITITVFCNIFAFIKNNRLSKRKCLLC